MSEDDTIFALSSASGRAGVAVLRVSGAQAGAALGALTGGDLPGPRRAALRRLRDPSSGDALDQGLVLWFPGPASFTGEDLAELQVHGGPAVVAALVTALAALPGLRPAEAGEFTRRAFHAGKLDLAQVEGLADLIAAETDAQRRQALGQMEGALSRIILGWRDRLARALAYLEAEIDFPDEDLPPDLAAEVGETVEQLCRDIGRQLADEGRGERLRAGFQVVLAGPPNAGKSSLLNALAQRDAAIVSETAGTTRDVIEVHLDLGGYPVTLADTAGLKAQDLEEVSDVHHKIEQEGMRRARARAAAADFVLAVLDLSAEVSSDPETLALLEAGGLLLLNKGDLLPPDAALPPALAARPHLVTSAVTGAGIPELLTALGAAAAERLSAGAAPAITRARHRQALEDCAAALDRAAGAALPELAAEDLRLALRALGRITGQVDVEDLLEVIFRDFCIGK